ncbi:maleylpyruvate isomerase family mycothiol-dependent enzyme [Gordonia sp. CPCC 205333]|uniref:maleylpyruvate isomerase family mycothiol-dependent enzyme n=1 Tax=Gordonia sp. CPCC 205333 TaxID=3140790 RepID=UPI003AF3C4F4
MKTSTEEMWRVVAAERSRLVADLAAVGSDAWRTPSLCPGWTVHDVLAHLVDSAKTTRISFVSRLIAARFDFDVDNERGIRRERRDDPAQTLDALREVISLTHTPPAAPATRLVEAFVHGEDIRRPLGIAANCPPDAVVQALAYQVKTKVAMGGGRERVVGRKLIATDADFECGDGEEMRGSAIDLLVWVSGRRNADDRR